MADQYGLIPLPIGVPFNPGASPQAFQPADIFGGFISGWSGAGPTQTLTASLVTNSQNFYAPTIAPSAVTLSPSLVSNAATFYAATVSPGSVTLSPSLVSNAAAFFSPIVSPGSVTLSPGLTTNASAFYAPSVTRGAVTLSPSLLTNAQAFYAPTVSAGSANLQPARYDNISAFYSLTLTPGGVWVYPSRLDNASQVYAPTVAAGDINLQPQLYVNSQTFFGPTIELGIRGKGWVPQIERKRKWSEEREEREQLRRAIQLAIDPLKEEATQATVITSQDDEEVAIVSGVAESISVPVPQTFSAAEVAQMVVTALERERIAVRCEQARQAFEVSVRKEQARIARRRRQDEEILLWN